MKNFGLSVLISILFLSAYGQKKEAFSANHSFDDAFRAAYAAYPDVPRGILEAIAWTQTRFHNIQPETSASSCVGIPQVYGPMGLVGHAHEENGVFPTGSWVAKASAESYRPQTETSVLRNPAAQIMACAAAYSHSQAIISQKHAPGTISWEIAGKFSGIQPSLEPVGNFALNSFLYSLEAFMRNPDMQAEYGFSAPKNTLEDHVGQENYAVLSASRISLSNASIRSANGSTWTPVPTGTTSIDYGPAIWDPAPSCNFSSRSGTAVSAVTIHTTQGSYSGAINWFKNCVSNVSAHYVIRSFDGQVTQMVLESDKAWHVGTENPYTIGLEHEGYVADASWYTNEMYNSSADLTRDIVNSGYGIDPLKTYHGPSNSGVQLLSLNCYKIKGHQHFPNQSHTDPGINWDWERYYRLINGETPAAVTNYSACSGTFYDPGGAGNNYGNQIRTGYLIAPAGATSTTLTFSAFDLESGYDYLTIYDGDSPSGDFLGKFDGTTAPGPFTSTSGKFYLEFRTDCATTGAGWVANWSCSTGPAACGSPVSLNTASLYGGGAEVSWAAVAGATSYEVRYRHSHSSTWTTHTTTQNQFSISGLAATSAYFWQVRALCGAGSSNWAGESFLTPSPSNTTLTSCSGILNDAGGDFGNYRNNENYTITIQPTGAGSITLNFTAFDLENNYDFVTLYDGPTTSSTAIGTYTGTNSPGTVISSGGAITLKFTSDNWTTKPGWTANWTCVSNLAPTTAINPLNEWYADDFTAVFADADNSGNGLDKRFYQVLEYPDSAWNANRGNGFLYETFDGGFPNWTSVNGNAYILNDRLHETDTVSTNTNNYIDLAQNSGTSFLYHFSARLWSGNSNKRFGIHFFVDDPTLSQRGNSYLVWFRGDNQTCEIYETIGNTLNLMVSQPMTINDFVWYDYKVTYEPSSGEIRVWQENNFVASWIDPTPLTAGSHVSLRTNQAHMDFENLRVYKSRNASQTIKIGPAVSEDARHINDNPSQWKGQVHSIVVDNSNNWSNVDFKTFKIDWTAPMAPVVFDGAAADIDTSFSLSAVQANWAAATDTNSGIAGYTIALGTSPGADDIVAWTNIGDTSAHAFSGLSLVHNTMYYVSVDAENLSGLFSSAASSDGFLVWSPTTAIEADASRAWRMWPNPATDVVRIAANDIPDEVRVVDAAGRIIWKASPSSKAFNVSTVQWPAGYYSVGVTGAAGTQWKRLVIIR